MALPTVRVLANPSLVCDHEGRPSCAIPFPDAAGFIGAVRTFVPDGHDIALHPGVPSGRYAFEFSGEAVELYGDKSIAYARSFAKNGELLPADEASAKALGVAWVAPKISKKPEADK